VAEKIRVYQLAKDLNISSKDLIKILQDLEIDVKSHMSSLDNDVSDLILEYLTEDGKKLDTGSEDKIFSDKENEVLNKKVKTQDYEEKTYDKKIKSKDYDELNKGEQVSIEAEEAKQKKKVREKDFFDKKSRYGEKVTTEEPQKPVFMRKISITDPVSIKELAERMQVPVNKLIKEFIGIGLMVGLNQFVNAENASRVGEKFGIEMEIVEAYLEEVAEEEDDDVRDLVTRPPVVTVMGHVDHGKTSLLDVIRETDVTATEAGGITQSIGAYQVEIGGKLITFIDTPGHEAFTAMRIRGANLTDIAVLVIAADDGVMPQTLEAINHARAAGVPIIVAINKIDLPQANPDYVKQKMADANLLPEEWGGEIITVPVSARTKEGIDDLLEMILLQAEMLELKANPAKRARGNILEAQLDKHKGPVATIIVNTGTLREGDPVIAGTVHGKIRAMMNYRGDRIKEATPSTPVEILGLSDVPFAGDDLIVCDADRQAKQIASGRADKERERKMKSTHRVSLDEFFKQLQEGHVKELSIIVKADTQGSVEALTQALNKLATDEVKVKIIHGGVGAVNESDIMLATVSNAIIIGFNIRADSNIMKLAENEKVDVRFYRIIYEVIDEVKAAMAGLLEPVYKEVSLGKAEIRATFNVSKVGVIGGAYVQEGKITRNASVRVIRDGVVLHEGKISSLKRFKDDAREVVAGYECGIGVDRFNGLLPKDIIEAFELQPVAREL